MELETVSTITELDERRALMMSLQALLEPKTLKILAALDAGERSLLELAELAGQEPSLSRGPLGRLVFLEIIAVRQEPGRVICRLNQRRLYTLNGALQRLSRDLFATERAPTPEPPADMSDEERRILSGCFRGERLIEIPENQRRLQLVLRWLAAQFEPGRRYPEREVNELIKRHHPDFATLRRALIDYGYMVREREVYWRTPEA